MQIYDKVRVIVDRPEYKKLNVFKGMTGGINLAEIRDNTFHIAFDSGDEKDWYIFVPIRIEDLEVIEKGWADDELILSELCKNDPRWWCKVEDGFIKNLLGDKKNSIPYDYNS